MLLPHSFVHFINWDSFSFRQEENCVQEHDNDPSSEEEENPGSHVTKHGEKGLSNEEGEEHVRANRDEESSVSGFEWKDFTWDQPPQRTP